MKKRTVPLLMLIAGLSVAALAACDHEHAYKWKNSTDGTTHWQECECGDKINEGLHVDEDANGKCDVCDAHVHNYVWKSDAVKHWQECECGDKKEGEEAHTQANRDGECEVCERKASLIFNMQRHGVAPSAQYFDLGGKGTEPAKPDDDDAYKFKGWFKDAACSEGQEFDFSAQIDTPTTVYAKWEEDTTPGASKKWAYELTKNADVNWQNVENGKPIYFKYEAEEEGRYTVALGSGDNSLNSTFTTSLTGDAVYGKGQASNEVTFDMYDGETVYVLLTFGGEDGAGVTAGVSLTETLNEPLPEDYFPSGDYFDSTYTFELDRAAKKIKFLSGFEGTFEFKYIGGKFDRIYFYRTVSDDTETWYLKHIEGNTYQLSKKDGIGNNTVSYLEPQEPVDLTDIAGKYVPQGNASADLLELYIYDSDEAATTVITKRKLSVGSQYRFESATYTNENGKNKLTLEGEVVTLNLSSSNTVESINVNGKIYIKQANVGEVPPENLPLEDNAEYIGTKYTIRTMYGSQYFGAEGYDGIFVLDKTGDVYTVIVDATDTYRLSINETEHTVSILDDNDAVLDTLTKFAFVYHKDFPTTKQQVTIQASDFQKNLYLYRIPIADGHQAGEDAGWFAFTGIPKGVTIYYGLNEIDPTDTYSAMTVGEIAVKFTMGMIVGVYAETPAEVSFTVAPASAPDGWEEAHPLAVTDGSATIDNIVKGETYYFQYTAEEAKVYLIHVFYGDGTGWDASVIDYTVNGETHSFGYNEKNPYAQITAKAGTEYKIAVTTSAYTSYSSVSVTVMEDYSIDAIPLELTGTPTESSLTVSATDQPTGKNYYIATTKGATVTVTGDAAFTVKLQNGAPIDAKAQEGKFVATIPAGTDLYFTVVSATQQNVTFTQEFPLGSEGYPISASATEGSNTITVEQTKTVYFTLTPGTYKITATDSVNLMNGKKSLTAGAVFNVAEGDVLSCSYFNGYEESVTLTVQEATYIFTEEQAGTYKAETKDYSDMPTKVTLTFDRFGVGTCVVETFMSPVVISEITIVGKDGKYTFERGGFQISFTFTEDGISVNDGDFEKTYTMEKPKPLTYTGTVISSDGKDTYNVVVVVNEGKVSYYMDNGMGLELMISNAALSEKDGTYEFKDPIYGDKYSFTILEDESGIAFHDGGINVNGNLFTSVVYKGSGTDSNDTEMSITLMMNAEKTKGIYLLEDPLNENNNYSYSVTIAPKDGGGYTATYTWSSPDDSVLTLTVDGENLKITDEGFGLFDILLTKQA